MSMNKCNFTNLPNSFCTAAPATGETSNLVVSFTGDIKHHRSFYERGLWDWLVSQSDSLEPCSWRWRQDDCTSEFGTHHSRNAPARHAAQHGKIWWATNSLKSLKVRSTLYFSDSTCSSLTLHDLSHEVGRIRQAMDGAFKIDVRFLGGCEQL